METSSKDNVIKNIILNQIRIHALCKALFLCLCSLTFLLTSCALDKDNNSVSLTPEFILAVQKYDALGEFSEGMAPVGIEKEDGSMQWGYINTQGEEIIPCKINALKVGCFSEGLACIIRNNKYSFINTNGDIVFTLEHEGAVYSEEEISFMIVKMDDLPYFKDGECGLRFVDYDKVIYVNKEGKTIREEFKATCYNTNNNEKFETFDEGDGYNNTGLKDKKGNIIVPAQYDDIFVGDGESGIFLATITDNGGDDGMMPDVYVGYVDMTGNNTFPEYLKKQLKRHGNSSPVSFVKALQEANWVESDVGFKIPDIMQKSTTLVDDYSIDTYTFGNIQLCYFWAGNWATFDDSFPISGSVIEPRTNITKITYTSANQGIYSGYLNDGRIFYLKRIISDEIPHAYVLAVVYPEDLKNDVEPLIKTVQNWKLK